jgi:putative tryptophan/tyrosine transport system substrate-binding protein
MLLSQRTVLVELAARRSIPVMFWAQEFVEAGGLTCYGTRITWMYHEAGLYCGRILKGAKASELPILQPAKFDLFINLKTAKALGVTVPTSLLNLADELIE